MNCDVDYAKSAFKATRSLYGKEDGIQAILYLTQIMHQTQTVFLLWLHFLYELDMYHYICKYIYKKYPATLGCGVTPYLVLFFLFWYFLFSIYIKNKPGNKYSIPIIDTITFFSGSAIRSANPPIIIQVIAIIILSEILQYIFVNKTTSPYPSISCLPLCILYS